MRPASLTRSAQIGIELFEDRGVAQIRAPAATGRFFEFNIHLGSSRAALLPSCYDPGEEWRCLKEDSSFF
jgi:hypothetical protein